ncbi:MAG: yncB [Nevskia sp.]|nr:yncB [Nevskia sp.]
MSETSESAAAETVPVNRRIVLAQRPSGAPATPDFRLETGPLPEAAEGQVLLRTLTLSLDPYMRGRMNDSASYAPSLAIGATMLGATISRVVSSRHPKFKQGDVVLAHAGWQDYAISDGSDLTKLPEDLEHPSYALGVLGMPGFTAYVGLLDLGEPQAGNTLVVAAATGAVGSVVGQLGKIKQCRVVGVAGGLDKCKYAVEELGFDACVDHYADDFEQQLKDACPQGVDIYFENVGGAVLDAVLPLLNVGARIPLCGLISYSNASSLPAGPDRSPVILRALLVKRVKLQGFIIFDHYQRRQGAFLADMSGWLAQGRVKAKEDVIEGLQHAPGALMGLLRGDNFGKLLVKVADA